jgi:hypothetical protein
LIKNFVIVGAVAAGLWFGWQWLFPSDEAQIVALLERVAGAVSSGAGEGDVGRLARAASLRDELAPDVTVNAPEFQWTKGREALIAAAAGMTGRVSHLTITFPEVAITITPNRQSAAALVTARAQFDQGGGREIDARELELEFTRHEGNWVISAVTLVQPLQRLP